MISRELGHCHVNLLKAWRVLKFCNFSTARPLGSNGQEPGPIADCLLSYLIANSGTVKASTNLGAQCPVNKRLYNSICLAEN